MAHMLVRVVRKGGQDGLAAYSPWMRGKMDAARHRWHLDERDPGSCKRHGSILEQQGYDDSGHQRWACERCWEEARAYQLRLRVGWQRREDVLMSRQVATAAAPPGMAICHGCNRPYWPKRANAKTCGARACVIINQHRTTTKGNARHEDDRPAMPVHRLLLKAL